MLRKRGMEREVEPYCLDLEGGLQVLLWTNCFTSLRPIPLANDSFFLTHPGTLEATESGGGSTLQVMGPSNLCNHCHWSES